MAVRREERDSEGLVNALDGNVSRCRHTDVIRKTKKNSNRDVSRIVFPQSVLRKNGEHMISSVVPAAAWGRSGEMYTW